MWSFHSQYLPHWQGLSQLFVVFHFNSFYGQGIALDTYFTIKLANIGNNMEGMAIFFDIFQRIMKICVQMECKFRVLVQKKELRDFVTP